MLLLFHCRHPCWFLAYLALTLTTMRAACADEDVVVFENTAVDLPFRNVTTRAMTRGGDRKLQSFSCGNGNRGNGVCANGQCCSQYGWCGTSSAHCSGTGRVPAPTAAPARPSGAGTCGNGSRGNGVCANGECCSQYGWCGTSSAHCSGTGRVPAPTPAPTRPSGAGTCGNGSSGNGVCANGECCSQYGWCGTSSAHCSGTGRVPAPTPAPARPSGAGTCGNGSRGNGVCANGECCSQYGWCGTSSAHCSGGPGPTPTTGGGTGTIGSSARTLSTSDLQAAFDAYNRLQGGSRTATQAIVDEINSTTRGYTLYRQLAFVAQTIWESGAFQYREELAATTPPFTTRNNYQDCDWNTPGTQLPANGKLFYGRGYIQLSWCANYRAYGAARRVNGDPNFFYNNPEVVATTYAMDASAWYFESNVGDNSGQFGLTTKSINGAIECSPSYNGNTPQKRFAIFDALAKKVGLTGYSSSGC